MARNYSIQAAMVILLAALAAAALTPSALSASPAKQQRKDGRSMKIRAVRSAGALHGKPGVEIEVSNPDGFPVRSEIAVLRVGNRQFDLSRYPDDGDIHKLIFTLTPEQFAELKSGEEVVVQYGRDGTDQRWSYGPLDKTLR